MRDTENTARELQQPVELIDRDLDEVAGGNPFSGGVVAFNSGSFAIGAVSGDFSNFAFSINTGLHA